VALSETVTVSETDALCVGVVKAEDFRFLDHLNFFSDSETFENKFNKY